MAQRKRHTPEQAVTLLRQIGAGVANGKAASQICKELEITARTYYRWRRVFGGLEENPARRLKQLEQENANLKRLVSELCLQKLVLRDLIASGRL